MAERVTHAHVSATTEPAAEDRPPKEVAEFIRYCHRRRPAAWPELYDVMCGIAARREFRGWGPEQLGERGLTFSLGGMPRLVSWVRFTLGASA
ncbi:MAG: hypothetical protein E6I62_02935 [Chloroflexi bacterium]|nr:MAG: hypothetical protein E6I62_02935 [Chloroflexota bacterium]